MQAFYLRETMLLAYFFRISESLSTDKCYKKLCLSTSSWRSNDVIQSY